MTEWPLAFGVNHVTWDGKILRRRPEADIRADLHAQAEAGLRNVHLAGFHYEEPSDFDLPETVRWLAGLVREYDLGIASHHCLVPTFVLPGTDQGAVRRRLLDTVDMLAPLGPTALVVHPGRAWGHFDTVQQIIDTYTAMLAEVGQDAMLETSADNLRAMARAAAAHGQTIALENLGRWEPLADADTLPPLVAAVGEPNLGYCYDSGHAHAFGQDHGWWLKTIGKRLFATHFHDNHGRGVAAYPPTGFVLNSRAIDEHLPVGFGTIPWQDIIRRLAANGYAGIVSFETGGWPVADPVESLTRAVDWWRAATNLALADSRKPL